MNNNAQALTAARPALTGVLHQLQRIESLHALIAMSDSSHFLSMSKSQQKDILAIASDMSLEARCLLVEILK